MAKKPLEASRQDPDPALQAAYARMDAARGSVEQLRANSELTNRLRDLGYDTASHQIKSGLIKFGIGAGTILGGGALMGAGIGGPAAAGGTAAGGTAGGTAAATGGTVAGGTTAGTVVPAATTAGKIIAAAGPVGKVLSGIASGRAAGRQAEIDANQAQDRLRQQAARDALLAPGLRAGASVRGDVMANARPTTITGPIVGTHGQIPTVTGGLSPGLFSDSTRTLGGNMSRDALLSQMQGPVGPTPLPQANGFDTALQIGGAAGLIGGTAGALFPPRQPPRPLAQNGLIDPTRPRSFV